MAAINSNGTGGGTWSIGASWAGGTSPGAGDTATVLAGDTITLTANQAVLGVTIAATGTLDIDTYGLTGMTANLGNSGALNGGAGCSLQFNDATIDRGIIGVSTSTITIIGTAGARALITNAGAGLVRLWDCPVIHLDYVDLHRAQNGLRNNSIDQVLWYIDHCDIEGVGGNSYWGVMAYSLKKQETIIIKNSFISGFKHASGMALRVSGVVQLENVVLGIDIDGNVQANTADFSYIYPVTFICDRVRATSGTQVDKTNGTMPARILASNWGCAGGVGTPGVGYMNDGIRGVVERSISAKKTGNFGARCTPIATTDSIRALESSIYVPIATGDDIAVSVYGRRYNMTSDCAEVELDPEGAWFTPNTSATALTNDDTWYEFTPSGAAAGGTADEGAVRIVLRLKEYEASDYFDWADGVITVTHADASTSVYHVTFEQWAMGMPVATLVPPEGGGVALGAFEAGAWR